MFKDKVIMVLGATGGIGSVVSQKIADKGGRLVLLARTEENLKALQEKLPGQSLIIPGDATNGKFLTEAVKQTKEKFGKIDVLIHCIGSIVLKPIHSLPEKLFKETLELNLVSPFLAIKAVIREMMKNKQGSIVVVSSVAGSTGLKYHEAISAAKGGLEAMIRSAAITYAKRGIRFNGVALGMVDTPLAQPFLSNELQQKASKELHPLQRIGTPEDAAEAIVYLASSASSWVTGTIIPVDGGIAAGQ
jgi:NAD(P)-dependent dehydrogenase (short-subunit alcohol dehydrogenase family)